MDGHRFDQLIRSFAQRNTARRSALRLAAGSALGVFGWLSAEDAGAHNALAKCRKIEDKKKRAKCVKAARRHNKQHKEPKPELECDLPCRTSQRCARMGCVEGECVVLEPVAAGQPCRVAAGECDIAETCDGESLECPADQFRPPTFECEPQICVRGSPAHFELRAAYCPGSSADCPGQVRHECGLYRCAESSCQTSCEIEANCINGAWCTGGGCREKQGIGTSCSEATPNQCRSGHCVGGRCCNGQCPTRPNTTVTCPAGGCTYVCHEGWAICGGPQSDGCLTDTRTDPDHCGGCDRPCHGTCGRFGQGTFECVNGRCDCIINP